MDTPPEPPAKELPPLPPQARKPIPSSPPPPNNLSAVPASKSPVPPSRPPRTRPPVLRPQAPLAMNPPTRPGTGASQTPGTTGTVRLPGSTKRLSWTSIASRRPIKYAQGRYGRVELVPQPSDDPDDPLVRLIRVLGGVPKLTTRSPELAEMAKRTQLLVPPDDGRHDRCSENNIHDCECPARRELRSVLYGGRRLDWRAPDSLSLDRLRLPRRIKDMWQAAAIFGQPHFRLHWNGLECERPNQLRPVHGSTDLSGIRLGRFRHAGSWLNPGHILCELRALCPGCQSAY